MASVFGRKKTSPEEDPVHQQLPPTRFEEEPAQQLSPTRLEEDPSQQLPPTRHMKADAAPASAKGDVPPPRKNGVVEIFLKGRRRTSVRSRSGRRKARWPV